MVRRTVREIVGAVMALLSGTLLAGGGELPVGLTVIGIVVLAIAWLGLWWWEKKHPAPPPEWAQGLRDQNENLQAMVRQLLPVIEGRIEAVLPAPVGRTGTAHGTLIVAGGTHVVQVGRATERDTALPISLRKGKGDWEILHVWGPDVGPSPEPGVIAAVRNMKGEKARIARCELTPPKDAQRVYRFVGAPPTDLAAVSLRSFGIEGDLPEGRYELRWVLDDDVELLTAAFAIKQGKLIP